MFAVFVHSWCYISRDDHIVMFIVCREGGLYSLEKSIYLSCYVSCQYHICLVSSFRDGNMFSVVMNSVLSDLRRQHCQTCVVSIVRLASSALSDLRRQHFVNRLGDCRFSRYLDIYVIWTTGRCVNVYPTQWAITIYTGEDGQNLVHVYHVYNRVHWQTLWLRNTIHMIRYLKQTKTNED
mgnify:CR=1 FL=1